MLNTHAFTTHEFFSLPLDVQFNLLKSGNKVFCRAEPRGKGRKIEGVFIICNLSYDCYGLIYSYTVYFLVLIAFILQ